MSDSGKIQTLSNHLFVLVISNLSLLSPKSFKLKLKKAEMGRAAGNMVLKLRKGYKSQKDRASYDVWIVRYSASK